MRKVDEEKVQDTNPELEDFYMKCLTIAVQIRKKFSRKWFTFSDLMSKVKVNSGVNLDDIDDIIEYEEGEMRKRLDALLSVGLIKSKYFKDRVKFRVNLSVLNSFYQKNKDNNNE